MGKGQRGFQKGNKLAVGRGRPPVILPELQREIDSNKNAVKKLILMYLNLSESQIAERQRTSVEMPIIEKWLANIIEKGVINGDLIPFKMLLEIPLGKLPEEAKEFEITAEEKALVVEFRRRVSEQDDRKALPDSKKDSDPGAQTTGD